MIIIIWFYEFAAVSGDSGGDGDGDGLSIGALVGIIVAGVIFLGTLLIIFVSVGIYCCREFRFVYAYIIAIVYLYCNYHAYVNNKCM